MSGTPDEVVAQIEAFAAAGVRHMQLKLYGLPRLDSLELFLSDVCRGLSGAVVSTARVPWRAGRWSMRLGRLLGWAGGRWRLRCGGYGRGGARLRCILGSCRRRAGRVYREVTGAEAGYVTSGSAAGAALSAAASIAARIRRGWIGCRDGGHAERDNHRPDAARLRITMRWSRLARGS